MTSKKKALKVVFVDDGTQEDLCYSGETLLAPLSQLSKWMLSGTPISFYPVSVSNKLWSTTEGNELHHTITVMDIYSDKSIEELRLEDYDVKKPNDCQGPSFGQAVESQQLFKQSTTKIKPVRNCKPKVHVNMITFQYDLEEITFKKKMECNYIRNPFSDLHVTSTSEDVVHHVFVRDKCFVSVGAAAKRLPHGSGILKTLSGKVLYSGEWCKGKRHGNGEAPIYAASCTVGDSTAQHGYYTGAWKHNMRHGRGKMYFTSGAVYDGQWKFDKMTGHGTLKLPDGSIQEGSWRDGKLHGCTVFTWPHGVCEYREYDEKQGQLRSCQIKEENLESISLKSSFYSQLMSLQECVNKLKDDKGILTEQLNAFEEDHAKTAGQVMASLCKLQEWKDDMRKNQDEFNTKLKETESKGADKIRTLENELEQSQNAQLCQICFERSRDCIIMPCTHLLYCRICVSEHKMKGVNRCPSCRGPISGEILCNINHS
ncbi:MORN repeat-containing protein 3 [Acropora cervicornis]|uniref:MORN repeat-containing protein 3 n=1 Tax=Acropora cervicornis TaxID=6130 RepID=A0AAD9QB92_ACRCE|nr:MORN repeat-containing protein 3 [Acropora cervicornis]